MPVLSIMPRLDENMRKQLRSEQEAMQTLRGTLVEDYLADPVLFVRLHGKRPEDLDGHYLRGLMK